MKPINKVYFLTERMVVITNCCKTSNHNKSFSAFLKIPRMYKRSSNAVCCLLHIHTCYVLHEIRTFLSRAFVMHVTSMPCQKYFSHVYSCTTQHDRNASFHFFPQRNEHNTLKRNTAKFNFLLLGRQNRGESFSTGLILVSCFPQNPLPKLTCRSHLCSSLRTN